MKRIRWILRRATVWALLAAFVVAAAMGVFTFVYEKNLYTATVTLYLRPTDATDDRFLLDCQLLATGTAARQKAERMLLPETLQSSGFTVSARALEGTHLLEISLTGPDAERSFQLANTIARELPQLLMEAVSLSEGKVVQEAQLPTAPSGPERSKKVILTFAICFVGLMLLALLLWPAKRTVDSRDIWPLGEKVPILANVSDYRHGLRRCLYQKRPYHTALYELVSKGVIEDVRTLTINLSFAAKSAALRSIVVTSRYSDEGKSSLVVLLATELARQDKSVLILDMDSYSPTIRQLLDVRCRDSLIDLFCGVTTMERVLTETSIPDLYYIGNRHSGENTVQLTTSTAFSAFMNHVYEQFDVVLVDTPPLSLYADALALGGVLDGTLLVAAENHETTAQLQDSLMRLEKAGAKLRGAVMTGVRSRGERMYHEYEAQSARVTE